MAHEDLMWAGKPAVLAALSWPSWCQILCFIFQLMIHAHLLQNYTSLKISPTNIVVKHFTNLHPLTNVINVKVSFQAKKYPDHLCLWFDQMHAK